MGDKSILNYSVIVCAVGIIAILASIVGGSIIFLIGLVVTVAGIAMSFKKYYERNDSLDSLTPTFLCCIITAVLVIMICIGGIVHVDAGERGVIVNSPAGGIGDVIDEGWHFNPMYTMCSIDKIRVNMQTTEYVGADDAEDTVGGITVMTKDNLTVDMDMAVTYHIPKDYVSSLRVTYGADWKLTILHQEVRSIPRLVCAQFTALEIVGEDREYVEQAIKSRLTEAIEQKGIIVDNVVIRELRIPHVLTEAVEQKLASQQMLEKAQIDLQRIQVEAQASAEAVDKVRSQFKTDEAYLQYILYSTLKDLDDVQIILSDNGTATVKVI